MPESRGGWGRRRPWGVSLKGARTVDTNTNFLPCSFSCKNNILRGERYVLDIELAKTLIWSCFNNWFFTLVRFNMVDISKSVTITEQGESQPRTVELRRFGFKSCPESRDLFFGGNWYTMFLGENWFKKRGKLTSNLGLEQIDVVDT